MIRFALGILFAVTFASTSYAQTITVWQGTVDDT